MSGERRAALVTGAAGGIGAAIAARLERGRLEHPHR
jgi:NAD(P)-dependent dehydrogenase (short-subunit alcohol dehydrogenase family)